MDKFYSKSSQLFFLKQNKLQKQVYRHYYQNIIFKKA